MMFDRAILLTHARRHGPAAAVELGVNFLLPFIVYSAASDGYGEVPALIASSAPPLVWSAFELIRKRRVDVISMMVLLGIALSVLGYFGGGGTRMLQLREKLATGVMGLVFLGSAMIGRPLIYELALAGLQRAGSDELAGFQAQRTDARFRRSMTIMTVVWGTALMADVAAGAALIFWLSVREYLIVGPISGYAVMGGLSGWTVRYARRKRREADAGSAVAPAPDAHPLLPATR